MVDQVVLGHPAHRKCHSSFYESNHRNDNFPFFPICEYPVWGTIPQGYSLGNMVLGPEALHTSQRIYKMFKPTHLDKLKEFERNFQRKETKNKRPKRLAEEKIT